MLKVISLNILQFLFLQIQNLWDLLEKDRNYKIWIEITVYMYSREIKSFL
jgi:hypothetical protein